MYFFTLNGRKYEMRKFNNLITSFMRPRSSVQSLEYLSGHPFKSSKSFSKNFFKTLLIRYIIDSSFFNLSFLSCAVGLSSNPKRTTPPNNDIDEMFTFLPSKQSLKLFNPSLSEKTFQAYAEVNLVSCHHFVKLNCFAPTSRKLAMDFSPDMNLNKIPWNNLLPTCQNCLISSEYLICLTFSEVSSLTTSKNRRCEICFPGLT